jgi:hypothetical protein
MRHSDILTQKTLVIRDDYEASKALVETTDHTEGGSEVDMAFRRDHARYGAALRVHRLVTLYRFDDTRLLNEMEKSEVEITSGDSTFSKDYIDTFVELTNTFRDTIKATPAPAESR